MGLLKRFRRQEIRADPDETMFEDALLTGSPMAVPVFNEYSAMVPFNAS